MKTLLRTIITVATLYMGTAAKAQTWSWVTESTRCVFLYNSEK